LRLFLRDAPGNSRTDDASPGHCRLRVSGAIFEGVVAQSSRHIGQRLSRTSSGTAKHRQGALAAIAALAIAVLLIERQLESRKQSKRRAGTTASRCLAGELLRWGFAR